MPLRRRPPAPADLVAAHGDFLRCCAHVDLAQRAMIRCVPSSARSVALPLAVGAETLRLSLGAASDAMPAWRHPAVDGEWLACTAALEATLAGVSAYVGIAAATAELEVALTAVQDLLDPLHAFIDAQEAFARHGLR